MIKKPKMKRLGNIEEFISSYFGKEVTLNGEGGWTIVSIDWVIEDNKPFNFFDTPFVKCEKDEEIYRFSLLDIMNENLELFSFPQDLIFGNKKLN